MAKHLVDIDEEALSHARRELGTRTIKDTVNLALRCVASERRDEVTRQLDVLASIDLVPREQAWR
jgi:Arc/MetJ family transcription regulator